MLELGCIGLSHKTAPVDLREKLALDPQKARQLLLAQGQAPREAVLLSTCNRVELYVCAESTEAILAELQGCLGEVAGWNLKPYLYQRRGEAALVHLFRVAASLDSMVVGEPQILGQVKAAFEAAHSEGTARGEMSRIAQAAFSCAKRVRSETAVGRAVTSMASGGVALAKKVLGGLEGRAVLLIGAGEMVEIVAKHLRGERTASMSIVNRTLAHAEALAKEVGGQAQPFEQLPAGLEQADIVVSCTAAVQPLVTSELMAPVLKRRRHRPIVFIDLGVPRDVEPRLNELDGVYVYDVDDIQRMVEDNAAARSQEGAKAEVIIAEEVARYIQSRTLRDRTPVIGQLRAHAEQIARGELERTVQGWGGELSDKQRRSLEAMAMAIVNKLLHHPTARLRAAGTEVSGNQLVGATAELFGLGEGNEGKKTGSGAP